MKHLVLYELNIYRKTKSSAMSVARHFSKFFDKQVDACIRLGAKPFKIYKRIRFINNKLL